MKKIRKWLGFCILTMLTVLAGITVFADGKLPGGKAYGTYFPNATIQKVWEDNDNESGKRPEKLTVNVAFLDYYNKRHEESVTLSAENNWTHRFPGEWKVTYDSEQGLTDDYGFKSYEVIEQGDNYLLKVTNGLRYPVNYAWTWEDENGLYQEQSDGYAEQYLPSENEKKYVAGTEVEVSSTHYVGSQATQDGIKYVFEGWDRQGKFIMPEEAVTISGKWKRAVPHTVSYEWEGLPEDAVQPPVSKSYYEYDYVYVDSSYRAGTYIKVDNDTYRFSGWRTDWEGFGNSSSFRMPDQDVIFKGKWEQVPAYTLNYKWKWDDGTGSLSDQKPANWWDGLPDTKNYAAGDTVTRDWRNQGAESYSGSGKNKQYYVFSGWKEVSYDDDLDGFYDAEEAKEEFLMPAKDMTLYGVWKKMPTFTVKYEWTFEGLTNVPSSPYLSQPYDPFYAGQMVSVRNTNYKNGSTTIVNGTKYQFSGWTAYKAGKDDERLAYDNTTDFEMPEYNIVFKGIWKPVDSYTVEYQWDGLPEPNSTDKDDYTVYSVLTVPEDRESPHIEGETVNKDMTSDQYVQTAESIDMDKAYKIEWSKYDFDTHKYAYKYTYYYFSGWTAYDKQEYTTVKKNPTPLELNIGADGTFQMPNKDILFVGHWKKIDTASYTVAWYKIANKNADPGTAQLIERRPNPDTRDGKVDEIVSVTERDMEDINEYGMYMFVKDYPHNVKKGTVLADGSLELKLYFAPETGELKVSKTVAGNDGEKNREFEFTVTLSDSAISGTYGDMEFADGVAEITLKHGDSATAEGLPAGIGYTVAEDDYSEDGYVTTQEGAEGTIPEDETVTASFTNTKEVTPPEPKLGDLKVSKTVEGNAGEKEKAFHFTITLSDSAINGTYGDMEFTDGVAEIMLKHGESATAEGLPAGIGYTVAEDDYSGDGYVTTQEGAEGTISEDETAEASFTNTKEVTPPEPKRGDLKVSKTVEGNAGDKEKAFHFTVTISDSAVNGTYGDMEFTDGVAEIMLKHGESATAEGIPAGIGYMIAEDDYSEDGYVTTQEGAEGTIPEDETATASFTNTKEVTPPEQPQKPDEDTPRPETGDSTSMGLYLSLLILSGLTCTILGVFKKKNYKNR